jgi:hypothetical protein
MMVGAKVGDSPHMGILVLLFGLGVPFGYVVDTVVVGLAIGIHHWSLVSLT